jgi:hypothetical protein
MLSSGNANVVMGDLGTFGQLLLLLLLLFL